MNYRFVMFGCSLLGMAVTGISIAQVLGSNQPLVEAVKAETPAPKFVAGLFTPVAGTDYLSAPVLSAHGGKSKSQEYMGDDYSGRKGQGVIHNYVFVNHKDLSSRKLLPDNQATILENQAFGADGSILPEGKANNKEVIKTVVYRLVKADTNGDQILNDQDRKTIAIADGDGSNYQALVGDVDRVLQVYNPSKGKQVIVYQGGANLMVASIDIAARSAQINKLQSLQ